jgi:hypothetical protein
MDGKEIGKAFLFGLAVFIGLNVLLRLLTFSAAGALDMYFANLGNYPVLVLGLLFGSVLELHGTGMVTILAASSLGNVLVGLSILVPGIVAALVVGVVSKSKYERIIAWILITLICHGIILIGGILEANLYSPFTFEEFLRVMIGGLIISIVFDGFFAIILPEK